MLFCAFRPQTYAETVTTTRSDAFYAPLLDEETDTDSVTPFVKAGFFSRMSFWWLNPLLTKGKGKILEDKDIPKLRKVDRAETCYSVFMEELSKRKEKRTPNPPMLSTIFFWQRRGILMSGFFALVKVLAVKLKQLRISNASKPTHSPGEITNYVTVDAYRIVVLVITLTVLGNYLMGNLQHKHLTKLLVSRDKRLKAIAEALANMTVLKLYAWETHFKNAVERLRKEELNNLSAILLKRGYNLVIFWSSPIIVAAISFWTCYVLGIPLNASSVFIFLTTLRLIQEPVRLIPDVVSEFIEANSAFTRIVKFLEAPELQNRHIGGDTGSRPPITRVYSCRSKKAYPVLLWLDSGLLTGPDA
ncbi:multidrug resistance-associated protein 14 [Actinidia rufa]|uniref:Multidrug resistance-associated protein 14 n=1 Tax=Actinidia rufa TaxID=165716 RepID=A0A7J0FRQ6_9ERIC|nr:multidrug resistance-associated protein 14 [Actinidia rufa]